MSLTGSIRLKQLEYLVAVARYGNFQDAAYAVGVSQSALSQGLARLQGSLPAPLFEAAGRSRILTPAGHETLSFAQRVLAEADSLVEGHQARQEGRAGVIRLGLIDAAALYLFDDGLQAFREQNPDVNVRITVDTSNSLLEEVDQYGLDVAVVVGDAPEHDAIQVLAEPMYVYGPEIADLREARTWVLYPRQSRTRRYIDEGLARAGVRPDGTDETSNPAIAAQMARLGGGWTVLPSGIAETVSEPLQRCGDLVIERPIYVVRRKTRDSQVLLDRLIESLCQPYLAE